MREIGGSSFLLCTRATKGDIHRYLYRNIEYPTARKCWKIVPFSTTRQHQILGVWYQKTLNKNKDLANVAWRHDPMIGWSSYLVGHWLKSLIIREKQSIQHILLTSLTRFRYHMSKFKFERISKILSIHGLIFI